MRFGQTLRRRPRRIALGGVRFRSASSSSRRNFGLELRRGGAAGGLGARTGATSAGATSQGIPSEVRCIPTGAAATGGGGGGGGGGAVTAIVS